MKIKDAMELILAQGISKYKIAKVCGVQPIMVDHWLTEKSKTVRRDIATALKDTWQIEIDDHTINGHTVEDFKNKHK